MVPPVPSSFPFRFVTAVDDDDDEQDDDGDSWLFPLVGFFVSGVATPVALHSPAVSSASGCSSCSSKEERGRPKLGNRISSPGTVGLDRLPKRK